MLDAVAAMMPSPKSASKPITETSANGAAFSSLLQSDDGQTIALPLQALLAEALPKSPAALGKVPSADVNSMAQTADARVSEATVQDPADVLQTLQKISVDTPELPVTSDPLGAPTNSALTPAETPRNVAEAEVVADQVTLNAPPLVSALPQSDPNELSDIAIASALNALPVQQLDTNSPASASAQPAATTLPSPHNSGTAPAASAPGTAAVALLPAETSQVGPVIQTDHPAELGAATVVPTTPVTGAAVPELGHQSQHVLPLNQVAAQTSVDAGPQLRADGQPQPATVAVQDLAQHAVATIRQRGADQGEARLALHPAELGHLDLKIEQNGQRIEVSVTVDNEQARRAVQEHMHQLRDRLGDAGMQLTSLDINLRDKSQRQNDDAALMASDHAEDQAVNKPSEQLVRIQETALDLYA